MDPDEIRDTDITKKSAEYFLREIAAQLAELNEVIRVKSVTVDGEIVVKQQGTKYGIIPLAVEVRS